MKSKFLLALVIGLGSVAGADTLILKNGDHVTGMLVGSDGKQVTLKTDYAGEIKVPWSSVQGLTSDKPFYVQTPDKKTVSGMLTLEGADLVVHTATTGEVRIPLNQLTVVRSGDEQHVYEKSLHPRLVDDWKGGVNLGFALARGNSDTTNLNLGFTADRKTLADETKINSSSIYTTNGAVNGKPGGVVADEVLGGARYDRNITKRLFFFLGGDFTHDALQYLSLRQIYTGGLGWHVINDPNTSFDLLAGANYTREGFSTGVAAASVKRNLPGLTLGEDFMHKVGMATTVTEDFTFYPDLNDASQYRFSFDAGMVTKIARWLGWQASTSDRYVTNPPILGTKSNDFILSTGFNIAFGQ